MKTKFTLFSLIAFCYMQAQVVTTIGNVSGLNSVSVPVTVDNFSNVGSLSLTIFYDNTVAVYDGLEQTHPSLLGTFGFDAGGTLAFSWLDMTLQGVTLNNGEKLFDLVFNQISEGTTTLSFSTDLGACEYSDAEANTLPSTYNNGSITFGPVTIIESKRPPVQIFQGKDYIQVTSADFEIKEVHLIEIVGKQRISLENNVRYKTNSLSKGIYFIKVQNKKGEVFVQKIKI